MRMRFDGDEGSGRRHGAPDPLSPAGVERRAAMLELLKREVSRRKARRTHARRGLAVGGIIALAALVIAHRLGPSRDAPRISIEAPLPAPMPAPHPEPSLEERLKSIRFEVVRGQPDLAERWRVRGRPREVKLLTDDDLLRELAAADVPSGLIRVPEGYILTADPTRPSRRG